MAIKNIVFDIGRVLKGWNPDLVPFFGEKIGRETYDAIWTSGIWAQTDLGILSDDEILRMMIENTPQREKEIRWVWDHLENICEYYSYSVPLVRGLKEDGYHVYYLSNYSERVRRQVPKTLSFLPYMDGGVFSCDINKVKPNPEIYQYLCKKYNLIPEECLFLDDVQENVDGAIRVGMNSIRFDGYEKTMPVIRAYLKENGAPDPKRERGIRIKDRGWKRVLVYGDSNTYGWDPRDFCGGPYERPWTSVFSEETGISVINRGDPGREIPTSAFSMKLLTEDLKKHAPVDALLIMLGTNDILNSPNPRAGKIEVKMDRFVTTMLQQLAAVQEDAPEEDASHPCNQKTEILLIVPPVIRTDVPEHYSVSRELAAQYKIITDRYQLLYADSTILQLPLAYDGVHLTEQAHQQFGKWLAAQ